jgi:hypothetical protein
MGQRRRGVEERWTAIAGSGSLGASYLPCCPARLLGADKSAAGCEAARARLALLWSERAAALRFRRAVLAMTARTRDERLELARIQREAFAYDAGAARLRAIRPTRMPWLIRLFRSRTTDRIVGATLATMSAELSVLLLAIRLDTTTSSDPAVTSSVESRDGVRSA